MPCFSEERREMRALDLDNLVSPDLKGGHTHLCPRCFEDAPCEYECTWSGDMFSSPGVPACHPTLCDKCLATLEGTENLGSGI